MEQKSLKEIESYFQSVPMEELRAAVSEFYGDPRKSVQNLSEKYLKKLEAYKKELSRLDGIMVYERKYAEYEYIAGIDEAGRGPLAGPVVAAAVILPKEHPLLYVNDSKKLSDKKREELFDVIMNEALDVSVGMANEKTIDRVNILQATYLAMQEAVNGLSVQPTLLLSDAVTIPKLPMKQVPIIKGDAKSLSIAAASIIAKVTRDRLMREYDKIYPQYGFKDHKGYGSKEHMDAIRLYGPCPIHRTTFIQNIIHG